MHLPFVTCSGVLLAVVTTVKLPIQRHPYLASMKVCEQKFGIIQYADFLAAAIYRHKIE